MKERSNFLNNIEEIKNDLSSFKVFLVNNIPTIIIATIFTLMAYGIKLVNNSISIDTEMLINKYIWQLDTWASFGRFGLVLTKKIFGLNPFNSFISCFLMIIVMIIYGMTWSYILHYFSFQKRKKTLVTCIFPIIFITAPLFSEQFNFILQGFEVGFAILLCSIAVFCTAKWTMNNKNYFYIIIAILCMIWGFGTYQAIVFLYVSGVLACYILMYIANLKGNAEVSDNYFSKSVFKYLFVFIIGYLSYYLVDKIVRNIYGASSYVDGMIKWGNIPTGECIKNILRYIFNSINGDGLFYNKVFFVCCIFLVIYGVVTIFKKNKKSFLFFASIIVFLLSPFLLSIYIGDGLIPRMQFTYQFVIAVVVYIMSISVEKYKGRFILVVLAICLSMNQTYTVVRLFSSEQLKYEDDVILANKISQRIESLGLGEFPQYPLVFVGRHTNTRPNKLTGEFLGQSWFEFGGNSLRAVGFLNTLGYQYVEANESEIEAGHKIALEMGVWPSEDSVIFKDGLIIIKLS